MKRGLTGLLWGGTLLPLVLLFWPFVSWSSFAGVLLRVIPALSLQTLLCRTAKHPALWAIPSILTVSLALWGTYLYCTSPQWIHATIWDLAGDYLSPFIACSCIFGVCLLRRERRHKWI